MTFALDLSRLVAKANGQTELVVRKVMLETFRGVVMKTPVLTGRARANWTVGHGSPNTTTSESTDRSGGSTIGKIASEVQTAKIGDSMSIYLTNALVYVPILEYGRGNGSPGSLQAPHGMVRITLTEIVSKYGR